MAVNLGALNIDLTQWTAGGDGKIRGDDPTGSEGQGGGSLEYTLTNHPTTVLWVQDGWGGTQSGTEAEPYATLRTALNNTTNGQGATIIVKDATINVTSANRTDWMINDRASSGFSAINSGASWATSNTNRNNMITIKAQTPYGVRMSYTGASALYYTFVHLENAEYISVDGFIFEYDETSGLAIGSGVSVGNNNYISRCIVKRAADSTAGSWFSMTAGDAAVDASGDNSLVEMCAGVGATRYGFRCGDSIDATTNHVYRLCIGRQDFNEWTVPSATFAHYGNNSGSGSGRAAFLNCLAVDGQEDSTKNGDLSRWASFYNPKDADDVRLRGCISLNETAQYAMIHAGENQASNMTAEDCVMWDGNDADLTQDGFRFTGGGTGNSATRLTIGDVSDGFYHATNSITPTSSRTSDTLNGTDKTILYQSDGADARYVFGSLGQRWGDAGFATKSATPVFPFPYQATIKSVFSEQLNTPTGHSPAGNVSARGFCAAASLTDYIVKYVDGTATINDVYP